MPRAPSHMKLLSCNGCLRKFRYADKLERHQLTHAAEPKALSCPYEECSYTTDVHQALKIHINIHTGEKPYKCVEEDCDRRFADPSAKLRHMKRDHGYVPGGKSSSERYVDTPATASVKNEILDSDGKMLAVESHKDSSQNLQSTFDMQQHTSVTRPNLKADIPRAFRTAQDLWGSFNDQANWYNSNSSYPSDSRSAFPMRNYNYVQPNYFVSDATYPSALAPPNRSFNPRTLLNRSINTPRVSLNPNGISYPYTRPLSSCSSSTITNESPWFPNTRIYDSVYFQNVQPSVYRPASGTGMSQDQLQARRLNASNLDAATYQLHGQRTFSNAQLGWGSVGVRSGLCINTSSHPTSRHPNRPF